MTRLRATLLALLSGLALAQPAPGAAPELISYQGVLTLSSGLVAPNGLYGLRFQIFDQGSSGNPVLVSPIDLTVDVRDGLYNVMLPVPADAFAEGTRFMEVSILSGPTGVQPATLTPRQQIASVPYALVARSADAVGSPAGEPAIPIGAIILWDQAAGCESELGVCPCGYQEAAEFRGLTIRGADGGDLYPGIPNEPGDFEGTPEGTGAYGDRLTIVEMPAHDHPGSATIEGGLHHHSVATKGGGNGGTAETGEPAPGSGSFNTGDAGNHSHAISVNLQGGGGSHYHPFRTVLFCRKQQ